MNYNEIKNKRILTGIQITSKYLHIGNYFGALHLLKELSKNNEIFLFIAEYHSLNSINKKEEIIENKKHILTQLYSIFKDYPNIYIYTQSSINSIPHIALLLGSVTPLGITNRAHKVKEAKSLGKEINVGTYYYPILMAADILTFDVDYVPVGKDQKQHLEIARDIALYFNKKFYKNAFKIPEPLINEEIPVVMGIDGIEKMSKSKNNYIGIFESPEIIKKKIMKISTQDIPYKESKNPDECNVYKYIKLFANNTEREFIRNKYLNGEFGYGDAKNYLFELILKFFKKEIETYNKIISNDDLYNQMILEIEKNNIYINNIAEKKLNFLLKNIGLKNNT